MRVAFLGLGIMGSRMAANLVPGKILKREKFGWFAPGPLDFLTL